MSQRLPAVPFSAAVLAGGHSQRMGMDKARLRVDGLPLLKRQFAILEAAGADDTFVSCRPDSGYEDLGLPLVYDLLPDLGPLGGILSALRAARHGLLLVIAVDLPAVSVGWLRTLMAAATPERGVVPTLESLNPQVRGRQIKCYPDPQRFKDSTERGAGEKVGRASGMIMGWRTRFGLRRASLGPHIEPLVACYPRAAEEVARRCLALGQRQAREFAAECVYRGLVRPLEIPASARSNFANWNTPADAGVAPSLSTATPPPPPR